MKEKGFPVHVRIGTTDRTKGGEVIAVKRTLAHPKYDDVKLTTDIGLVELAKDSTQRPITFADSVKVGDKTRIIGWGFTNMTDPCPCRRSGCRSSTPAWSRRPRAPRATSTRRRICASTTLTATRARATATPVGRPSSRLQAPGGSSVPRAGPAMPAAAPIPTVYTNVLAFKDWIAKSTSA